MDDLALGGEVPLLPVRAVTLSHVNIRVVLTWGTLELSMSRSRYSRNFTSGLSLLLATWRHMLVTGLLISAAVPGACCVVTCTHYTCHNVSHVTLVTHHTCHVPGACPVVTGGGGEVAGSEHSSASIAAPAAPPSWVTTMKVSILPKNISFPLTWR